MHSHVFATGLSLAFAAGASAQSLPSPFAPTQVSAARTATANRVTPVSHAAPMVQPNDVTNAEHVFNYPQQNAAQQVGHICNWGYAAECPDDSYASCWFNPDAEPADWSDGFWENMGVESCLDIGGWVQGGYHDESDGVFNTYPDKFQAQQVWLYAEKLADGSDGFDWGFRADMVYGTDAQNTQAFGNPPGTWDFQNGFDHGVYGWAFPQLYGEIAVGNLSVKAGHFFTAVGYEVVPATGNFFYSHAFTMNFSEPFTHTGVLATYAASDDVTLYGGWTAGWDTGFEELNNGSSMIGGIALPLAEDVMLTYIFTAGKLGWIGEGYSHSIVADWTINDKWEYVLQNDVVNVDSSPTGPTPTRYDTVSLNNYLFYTINDFVKVGGRAEWWKLNGTSFYETTAGVNVTPAPNLTIRPEIRYQWSPGAESNPAANPFGIPLDQTIFGVDVIYTF
jgi:hypothetical protein